MLILPLYGICAIALTGIFFPWIKALQEPSIGLLYSASAISRDCFKDFGDWLRISTGDTGNHLSPLSSLPLIVYLPTPSSSSSNSSIWNGTKKYILLPTGSSLATVTQPDNSLTLVTPFKVHPPRFPPPLSVHGSGRAVNNDGVETFAEELIISNDGLPLFLGLVASVLVSFHLVVYVSWKREMARLERQAAEEKPAKAKAMEDLSKAKIVLDKTKAKDSYLEEVLDGLDTISKQSEASSEVQVNILEHLYTEGDSSSAPTLFSVKRWTMSKSEFESTYGAVPRAPSVEPLTAVPQFPVEESLARQLGSERTKSNSDIGTGINIKGPAIANIAQRLTRQSDSGGRPTIIHATDRPSTVVPNLHVETPSVLKRPFVPESARRPQRPRHPPRPIVFGRTDIQAMVDIHARGPLDTNTNLRRRENVPSPSTTVDIRVEGASDQNIVKSPSGLVMPSPVADTVEPSAMVDIYVEGAPVAKVTGAGRSQPDTSTVESGRDDGYDRPTSVQTAILAPRSPSTAAAAAARVEVQASPQTESPQREQPSGRRRRNRMGQRQRRRLREMRENRGWGAIQQSPQSPHWEDEEELGGKG
jgi:hypothetical protein